MSTKSDTQQIDVKAVRKAFGWTQADLAKLMGVNLSTVWRWENGTEPKGAARALLIRLRDDVPADAA